MCKILLQTIHQARAEFAHGGNRQRSLASSDERVLPDTKAHLRAPQDNSPQAQSSSPMHRSDRVSPRLLLIDVFKVALLRVELKKRPFFGFPWLYNDDEHACHRVQQPHAPIRPGQSPAAAGACLISLPKMPYP